ncbi:hypothetical protein DQ354_19380 [Arthrobacter sp. AQ5-06]|nr:hypothetical protein DQ354_19380 [Arthrobacter sp. AQ5-06]
MIIATTVFTLVLFGQTGPQRDDLGPTIPFAGGSYRGGRPTVLTPECHAAALLLQLQSKNKTQIWKALSVSRMAVALERSWNSVWTVALFPVR